MSYSRLLMMKKFLCEEEYKTVVSYLESLSRNSKINPVSFSVDTGLVSSLVSKVLSFLEEEKIIKCSFAIKCPECGLFIKEISDITEINGTIECYKCEEEVQISSDDVLVLYSFIDYPFRERQQDTVFSNNSVAISGETELLSLTDYLINNDCDINSIFFNPNDKEYVTLQSMYDSVFGNHKNTKEKGDSLEDLVLYLFSLCKHFKTSKCVRTRPNQIDCYVRNKLFIPGLSNENCKDSFIIECKNEKRTPSGTYFNKLHSIMITTGSSFGVIVSKCHKPKTYGQLSNKIFLCDKKIIIAIDSKDLKSIIYDKNNLLELMEKYISEVKLDATRDLLELGLYDA